MPIRYYSTAKAAEALDLGRMTIWRLIRDGKLPASNIAAPGQKPRYRIREEDLHTYMESLRLPESA